MTELLLLLRKSSSPFPAPCLYIEEPESLNAQSPAEFGSKFRVFLDDLRHLKFLDHIRLVESPDLSPEEKSRLHAYGEMAKATVADIWKSLGDYEDSLLGIKNLFENIDTVLRKPDISHFKIATPFYAIVVSAGPSLELELPLLREIQNKVLLVCVDAAFKTLLRNGITPHIVVAMERDDHSVPFFRGLEAPLRSVLVANATVKKAIFDSYPGPIATALKYSGPFLWLPFNRARFWTASSSAHLAYRLSAFLKPHAIALVGQDLCFHPETLQSHSSIPDYPEWSKPSSLEERLKNQKAFKAEGNTISEVYTDPTWSLFARDYQVIVDEVKIPTFNTSRLGMKIGNIPYEPLDIWIKRTLDLNELGFQFPTQNPDYEIDQSKFKAKISEARNTLTTVRKSLEAVEHPEVLYEKLPSTPHFLELVFEVVFLDWVRSQNRILNAEPTAKRDFQRQFLNRARGAIERVLELLPQSQMEL